MAVAYSLIGSRQIENLISAENVPGTSGPATRRMHAQHRFGTITSLQYDNHYFSINDNTIHWKKPENIVAHYDYPAGLFTRIVLDNPVHEYLKGSGEIFLKKNEYAALAGESWTGLLSATRPARHHFVDIAWSARFLEPYGKEDPVLAAYLRNIRGGVAEQIPGPAHPLNDEMSALLTEMLDNLAACPAKELSQWMNRFFVYWWREVKSAEDATAGINAQDIEKIEMAMKLVDVQRDNYLTIPQISIAVGMNEQKLKSLFPRVTGFKIDEYRKYHACIRVRNRLLDTREPLKILYAEAGYSSLPSFIAGFRKVLFCTPGELRKAAWDFARVPGREPWQLYRIS